MNLKEYLKNLFKRTIISLLLFFFLCLLLNNDKFYIKYYDIIFKSNIDFSYIRSKTNILFGKLINKSSTYVSSEKIIYKSIEEYNNSYKLEVGLNYVVNNIKSGTVIYIGEKDNLGTTIIINGDDGINYWYSNIENISVNLYDYVNSSSILGSTINEYLYLTFNKESEYLSYETFI